MISHAEAAGDEADQPEDLQRPRRVAQQELDGRQIEHDADGARQAVLRRAGAPRPVIDDHLGDLDADLAGDRRQEPVHLAVEPQRLDDFGAEHLQRAAVVVQRHAGRPRDQPVGDHRRHPPGDEACPSDPCASRRRCRCPARSAQPSRECRADRSAGRRRRSRPAGRARARSRPQTPRSARSCGGNGSRAGADRAPAAPPAARTCHPCCHRRRSASRSSARTAPASGSARHTAA